MVCLRCLIPNTLHKSSNNNNNNNNKRLCSRHEDTIEEMEEQRHSLCPPALDRASVELHVTAASSPGKNLRYPLTRRLGGPQNLS